MSMANKRRIKKYKWQGKLSRTPYKLTDSWVEFQKKTGYNYF